MNADTLQSHIIAALAEEDLTLVELHQKIHADSRHMLAVLQSLGGQKLVTCTREPDRGMVWSLIGDPDDTVGTVRAPAPAPPPPQPRAVPTAPRPTESNATVVLRWITQAQRPVLVREIIAGTGMASQSVYNTLTDLARSGRVVKGGQYMRTTYSVPGQCAPQPETVQAITRAIEKAATPTKAATEPPAVDKTPVNSEPVAQPIRQPARISDVAISFSVPIDKARAVIAAVEQVLAA